jgi:hypothetical protein
VIFFHWLLLASEQQAILKFLLFLTGVSHTRQTCITDEAFDDYGCHIIGLLICEA